MFCVCDIGFNVKDFRVNPSQFSNHIISCDELAGFHLVNELSSPLF